MDEKEIVNKLNNELNSYSIIFGSNGCSLWRNAEIEKILNCNKKVYVTFKFDWNNYNSWIVVTGADDGHECKLNTPQIPLLGGCWSDYVATRCITGQTLISAMLESVSIQLKFITKNNNKNTDIVKCDKCFYAPFLYYTVDESGNMCDGFNGEKTHKEYNDILKIQNPVAYKQICDLKSGENYWTKYHDVI